MKHTWANANEGRFGSAVVVIVERKCAHDEFVFFGRADASDFALSEPGVGEQAGEGGLGLAWDVEKDLVSVVRFVFLDDVVCDNDDSLAASAKLGEEVFEELNKLAPVLDAESFVVCRVFRRVSGCHGTEFLASHFGEKNVGKGRERVDDDRFDIGMCDRCVDTGDAMDETIERMDVGAIVFACGRVVEKRTDASMFDWSSEIVVAVEEVWRWEMQRESGLARAWVSADEDGLVSHCDGISVFHWRRLIRDA